MFLPTRAINVTIATRSRRNTMNTNTIDSESTGMLELEVAKTNGKRTPAKKAKSAKKGARAKKDSGQTRRRAQQQRSQGNRDDETRQRRDVDGDHGCHEVAGAYGARLCQHPRQQSRGDDQSSKNAAGA